MSRETASPPPPAAPGVLVLGVDAGLTATGVAEVAVRMDGVTCIGAATVRTEPGKTAGSMAADDARRAAMVFRFVHRHLPGVVLAALELPTGSKNARTARKMGYAAAACVCACAAAGVPWIVVSPREVKLAGCGRANASKVALLAAAQADQPHVVWPKLKAEREHAVDAFWAAVAAADHSIVQAVLRGVAM